MKVVAKLKLKESESLSSIDGANKNLGAKFSWFF